MAHKSGRPRPDVDAVQEQTKAMQQASKSSGRLTKCLIWVSIFAVLAPIATFFVGQQSVDPRLYDVIRVVDGDTLDIEDTSGVRTRIRLAGYDAPEPDEPGGAEATAKLKDLVDGKRVAVTAHAKDKYGRTIALIYADGVPVVLKLVEWRRENDRGR